MADPNNQKSVWSRYFVSKVSFEKVELRNILKIASRMYYSLEARKNISNLLDGFHPNIAHIHSIYHHISPSIIFELNKRNIPIVQTVHDYHLIAPNHTLFHNGRICEITKSNKYYNAIFHKCIKNSYFASLADTIEHYFHSYWNVIDYINFFIAPSKFMRDKLIEYGLPSEKIYHLPNFIDCHSYPLAKNSGDYILYFGRLSPEKGLKMLVNTMKLIPNIKLKIVGSGSEEKKLKSLVKKSRYSNIEFIGYRSGYKLIKLIKGCRFTILPSIYYENSPNVILEAFACGKPVVASRIGGIPELIKDKINGYLFEADNSKDCADKIFKLWQAYKATDKLSMNARQTAERFYNPERHYSNIMKIYSRLVK
jgi:glycosyltransferase involved in cell wall biosynthesis